MVPWELIERVATPDGLGALSLHRRGAEFSIRIDNQELMNSRMHGSEEAMATLAAQALSSSSQPRVLVGGLGMGFTLAAALQAFPPGASVEVAELVGAVIRWNRGPLASLAGDPLADPRVTVQEGDVRARLVDPRPRYDAILLDVDNDPAGLTQASNESLYGSRGLQALAHALGPRGILSVWSARDDRRFSERLSRAGFASHVHRVPARGGRGGGPTHAIWIARKRDKSSG